MENGQIKKLLDSIDISNIHGLRLRTYLEILLNTGLRPGEALKLNRDVVDREEVEIIGKGSKKRIVYFNNRAKFWIKK